MEVLRKSPKKSRLVQHPKTFLDKSLCSGVSIPLKVLHSDFFFFQDDTKNFFVLFLFALTAVKDPFKRQVCLETGTALAKVAEAIQAKVLVEAQIDHVEFAIKRLDRALKPIREFVDSKGEQVQMTKGWKISSFFFSSR